MNFAGEIASLVAICVALTGCETGSVGSAGRIAVIGGGDPSPRDAGSDARMDAAGMDAANTRPAPDGATQTLPGRDGQAFCGQVLCACSDGLDNDGDGLIDQADPACVSPFVNEEDPYTGIWNDHRVDSCQGCFFSGNTGAGADGCRVPYSCLTVGEPSPIGNCSNCVASQKCQDFCRPYVPNGCDCFGCCGVLLNSGVTQYVLLDVTCDINGDVSSGCTACRPSDSCANPCGRCELCPGKTREDLPADCGALSTDDGGVAVGRDAGGQPESEAGSLSSTCDDGETLCGAGLPSCIAGQACAYGCCIVVPAH
ncbi:MAG: hypothetical protein JWN04_5033 [Myxococcaceae bacterium]|nr:hypothetical protein [Myxococcaceae bacterium]